LNLDAAAPTDGTDSVVASAKVGFSGVNKCTFNVVSKIALGAPSMKLTAADSTEFELQWAEWESGALSAKTGLVGANATPLWTGAIGTGEWPNPIIAC